MEHSFFKYLLFCTNCDTIEINNSLEEKTTTEYNTAREFVRDCNKIQLDKKYRRYLSVTSITPGRYVDGRMVYDNKTEPSANFFICYYIPFFSWIPALEINWNERSDNCLEVRYRVQTKILKNSRYNYDECMVSELLKGVSAQEAFDYAIQKVMDKDEVAKFVKKQYAAARLLKNGEWKVFKDDVDISCMNDPKLMKKEFNKNQIDWLNNGDARLFQVCGEGRTVALSDDFDRIIDAND